MPIIGGNDARDEGMAHHVLFAKAGDAHAFHAFQDGQRLVQALSAGRPAGRFATDRR